MKYDYAHTGTAGIGALALALLVSGCGGSSVPSGMPLGQNLTPNGMQANQSSAGLSDDLASPDRHKHHRHHHGYCAAVTISQNFNGQSIAKGSWMLFTSATQFPGNHGALRVEMKDSRVRFSDGLKNFTVTGPDMTLTINGGDRVKLKFGGGSKFFKQGGWTMKAPINTGGNDFLDDMVWRVSKPLPGNMQNVTWSAKFYSRSDIQQMHWQWGAANYTRLSTNYQRLAIKPLDDNHYPPYNSDPAGTPERYKAWYNQQGGGTGGNYTGMGGPTQNVTPCT